MTKSIAYAYPTSTNAMQAGKPDGFYVQGWAKDGVTKLSMLYDTIKEAEDLAETLPEPWAETYKRLPLRGSKFWRGA